MCPLVSLMTAQSLQLAILTNSIERNPLAIQSLYQSQSLCSGAGVSSKSLRAAVLFVKIEVLP